MAIATNPASAPYSWGLIEELAKRKTPIDFFSWHAYTTNTGLYTTIATSARQHLDAAGLNHVALHCTEWFPCILCPEQDTARGAAALTDTLTRFVDAGVTLATLYPLCSSGENRTGFHGWGLFDDESVKGKATWRPLTYAFQAFGHLVQGSSSVIEVLGTLQDTIPLAVRGDNSVQVMFGMQTPSNSSSIVVHVSGLSEDLPWRYEVWVINNTMPTPSTIMAGVSRPTGGIITLPFNVYPPSVVHLSLQAVSSKED